MRQRNQKGSLQIRKHGKTRVYVALYRDEQGSRRYVTLGKVSRMTKANAEARLAELVAPVNGMRHDPTLQEFVNTAYFPFGRRKWKESTRDTTEQRIRTHLIKDIGARRISELRREFMAEYLDGKADRGVSHSLVAHLRWDLKAILDLAVADQIVPTNQAVDLYVPKTKPVSKLTATPAQSVLALSLLDIRERLIVRLALFVGLRPGEILAMKWKDVIGNSAHIERRVYRGKTDTVKNQRPRTVALPSSVVRELERWMELSLSLDPNAWVFPTETGRPGNRDSFWRRAIVPRFENKALDWLNFQVMRRTWATLAAGAGINPKVRADQLGHGVDVDINEYTQTDFSLKLEAVNAVEQLIGSEDATIQ